MRLVLASGALFLLACPIHALAEDSGPGATVGAQFGQVTGLPTPLQSTSGRFSSLSPSKPRNCPTRKVTGRVVSASLIMVDENFCGRGQSGNVLVNVQLGNPADAAQMVIGRRVAITAAFKNAEEERTDQFYANYLIAEKAKLVALDPSAAPAPAFTSYMICQPPELDTFARQLGKELCVQNTLVANLTATGPALEAAARTPVNTSPEDAAPGDPNAIVCHPDLERSDVHLSSVACARGSYWDWYNSKWRDRLFLTPAPP